MKLKILSFGFIILIFGLSCKEPVIEQERSSSKTNQLKSSKIGTVYYVAQTGNDGYLGTLALPFRTIQKAADVVNPGDTVIIRDGRYTSNAVSLVNVLRGGVADNYVVFKAEHKWGAILDGQGSTQTGLNIGQGASYIKFIDLALTRFTGFGYLANHSGYIEQYITIQGNKIYEIGRYETTSSFGICAIYIRRGNHDWTIDKNLILNIGRTGPENYYMNKDHAVYTGTTDSPANAAYRINVTNNIIYGISGATLCLGSNYDLVSNNVFAWRNENTTGAGGFIAADGDVSGLTITNNIFYEPPTRYPFALYGYAPFVGWVIKNNMIYGGRMWDSDTYGAANKATMAGGNYGQTDCENGEVDPKFVSAIRANAPDVDFRLQATSPAINFGVNVGLTSDYLGNPLIGPPDIGAYESSAASATIGLNTIAGLSESADKGYWIANSYTAVSNITVNRMNLYVTAASGTARLGIYSNNGGEPGTLLAQTGEISLSNGWNSSMLGTSQNLKSGGTYWLAIEVNSSATTMYYNSVRGRSRYKSYTYGALPSAAPLNCDAGGGIYSVYADNSNGSAMVTGVNVIMVTDVSVNPASAGISVNATKQLIAAVSPSDATNKNVSWSSGNTSVATVNSTGFVTGIGIGSTTITATAQDGGKIATSVITVSSGGAASLGLNTIGSIAEKDDQGYWIANSYKAVSNITVSKMNLYVNNASGKARLGIYSSNGSEPGSLLAQTGEISLTNGWNSSTLGTPQNLTSGVTYWLAVEVKSSATTLYYNSATGRLRYKPYTYGSLPTTAPLNCVPGTGIYSLFAF